MNKDKIILGIDPGTRIMGYGLLQVKGKEVKMLAMGVIDMHKCADIYLKLGRIYERVINVINSFHPDELAIEAPFCGKNVQSMLKLGRAQGVVIAAAISRQIPVHEYAPTKIKMTITGNGNASKEQVASVMKRMLRISQENMLPWMDATDALAAAYCHYLGTLGVAPSVPSNNSASSWKDFARRNPGKVRGL
ncbi:MAG: crossover junction endodeoxyribonuclease RuvC [Prevotellamassilia sp.]|nr:crossover junction endodeoxyribonuclease RuvC [Prevotellamassilia sp.]